MQIAAIQSGCILGILAICSLPLPGGAQDPGDLVAGQRVEVTFTRELTGANAAWSTEAVIGAFVALRGDTLELQMSDGSRRVLAINSQTIIRPALASRAGEPVAPRDRFRINGQVLVVSGTKADSVYFDPTGAVAQGPYQIQDLYSGLVGAERWIRRPFRARAIVIGSVLGLGAAVGILLTVSERAEHWPAPTTRKHDLIAVGGWVGAVSALGLGITIGIRQARAREEWRRVGPRDLPESARLSGALPEVGASIALPWRH